MKNPSPLQPNDETAPRHQLESPPKAPATDAVPSQTPAQNSLEPPVSAPQLKAAMQELGHAPPPSLAEPLPNTAPSQQTPQQGDGASQVGDHLSSDKVPSSGSADRPPSAPLTMEQTTEPTSNVRSSQLATQLGVKMSEKMSDAMSADNPDHGISPEAVDRAITAFKLALTEVNRRSRNKGGRKLSFHISAKLNSALEAFAKEAGCNDSEAARTLMMMGAGLPIPLVISNASTAQLQAFLDEGAKLRAMLRQIVSRLNAPLTANRDPKLEEKVTQWQLIAAEAYSLLAKFMTVIEATFEVLTGLSMADLDRINRAVSRTEGYLAAFQDNPELYMAGTDAYQDQVEGMKSFLMLARDMGFRGMF